MIAPAMKAPLPPGETERLAALRRYDVLDTLPEQAFDDLTQLAAYICEAPIAVISLVEQDRQWFKSRVGLSEDGTLHDTAFCSHAMDQTGLFIVPDASQDTRFAANTLVTGEPHIRFYAGSALRAPDGHALGTLCVMDRVPRQLGAAQEQALRVLSRQVMSQLELQRIAAGQAQTEARARKLLEETEHAHASLLGILEDQTRQGRQMELLLQSTAEGIYGMDMEGYCTFINHAATAMLGCEPEEVLGRNMHEFIHHRHADGSAYPVVECPIFSAFKKGERCRVDTEVFWRRNGQSFPVEYSSLPISENGRITGAVVSFTDITERRKSERLALRSQRLESIGTLAGGVAHDLNNALAPIMMVVELLRMRYPEDAETIDVLETSAQHGADMVRQLLSFAKGAEGERVCIQPGHLVKNMATMMKGSFPKNLQLAIRWEPKLPTVLGDPTQLHQVLLNLCVNARDAMPNGGTLTLEAQRVEMDAAYASAIHNAKPGHYVVLRVRDTGAGIPAEILDRIFDPFFTTKGPDKGTGLGLSTVMGIVQGHGGFVQVYSQAGEGSTFAAYLPADLPGGDADMAAKKAVEFRGQGETILFVDDEPAVREVARAVLRRLSFQPLTATDGADGLIQAAQHRTELRAIVTDLHMPHMDGLAFVRTIRRMLPDIPIVVASGRMEEAVAREFDALGVTSHMDKPFTEGQLAEALKNLLAPK